MFLNTRAHEIHYEVLQELKVKYAGVNERVAEVVLEKDDDRAVPQKWFFSRA